jgi:hypothetical protein
VLGFDDESSPRALPRFFARKGGGKGGRGKARAVPKGTGLVCACACGGGVAHILLFFLFMDRAAKQRQALKAVFVCLGRLREVLFWVWFGLVCVCVCVEGRERALCKKAAEQKAAVLGGAENT